MLFVGIPLAAGYLWLFVALVLVLVPVLGSAALNWLAVTVPFLGRLLQTTPLSGLDVVTVATAAGLPLLTHELRTHTVRPGARTTPRGDGLQTR
jgi:hypothetical protein